MARNLLQFVMPVYLTQLKEEVNAEVLTSVSEGICDVARYCYFSGGTNKMTGTCWRRRQWWWWYSQLWRHCEDTVKTLWRPVEDLWRPFEDLWYQDRSTSQKTWVTFGCRRGTSNVFVGIVVVILNVCLAFALHLPCICLAFALHGHSTIIAWLDFVGASSFWQAAKTPPPSCSLWTKPVPSWAPCAAASKRPATAVCNSCSRPGRSNSTRKTWKNWCTTWMVRKNIQWTFNRHSMDIR